MSGKNLFYISSSFDSDYGIQLVHLDMASGELTLVEKIETQSTIQYMVRHTSRKYLYATGPAKNGNVYAYRIEYGGRLIYLNHQSCVDNSPCYVSIDNSGRYVLVSNYSGDEGCGSVCAFPILEDGQLGKMSDYVRHAGHSVHPRKQQCTHPHSVLPSPNGNYILVQDLGIDAIMVYELDTETGKLNHVVRADIAEGSGPRHIAFHPTQSTIYLLNELNTKITVLDAEWDSPTIEIIQTIDTLPENHESDLKPYPYVHESGTFRRPHPDDDESTERKTINRSADIHVTPDGKFAYASNRGHNSLAMFDVDELTGKLTLLGHQSTLGDWPRGFAIEPQGKLLFVANQWSDDVFTFWIDSKTGQLTATGYHLDMLGPICIIPVV